MSTTSFKPARRLCLALTVASIVAAVTVGAGAYFDTRQFAFSYLFAFLFFFTICVGALFWVLVHHMAKAEWSVVVRRQLENIAAMSSILAILFIPLIFVAPMLWSWMAIAPGADALLEAKRPYLTPWFFWVRSAFYLCFFSTAAIGHRWLSMRQDHDASPRWSKINRKLALAGLPIFAFALTFAAIDWLMGLDYRWYSTIWGVYFFAGAALSGLCMLVLIVTALHNAGYLKGIVTLDHYHILGKLMLAFTIFWAYIAYSQHMLIWYSNIPEETVYFAVRNSGSWRMLNLVLVAGHFAVPFLLLLPAAGKRRPGYLCGIATWILAMHLLDIYVIVLPVLHSEDIQLSWLDLACPAAIGLALAAIFLKGLGNTTLWPTFDPRLKSSLRLKS